MRPFLNVNRKPAYSMKEEYADYPIEENKEIYLSSAWFKSDDSYVKFKNYLELMLKGKDYFVLSTNYRLPVHHGLLSETRAESMRKEMDDISWAIEMESLWWGESESAFFKSTEVNPCRTVVNPYYPPTDLEIIERKDKKYKNPYPKLAGEIRLISADIALCEGKNNDNSVFTLMRMIPEGDGYARQVVHIESYNGMNSDLQALRLKKLFFNFEADKLIIDATGLGMSIFHALKRTHYCQETNTEYPSFSAYNIEEDKYATKGSLPVIYALKVTTLQQNHEIAMNLKDAFIKNKIHLLINDIDGKDHLIDNYNLLKKSPSEQSRLLAPYTQTTAMVNEIINLEYIIHSGYVKVFERGTARKDRYSSVAYLNYLANLIEKEELRKKKMGNDEVFAIW